MSKRAILDAAKRLLWKDGYEAMSPRRVMDTSGAGQGSLYHHFKSKQALADAALAEIEDELLAAATAIFSPERAPLARIKSYLMLERNGLEGCRLGRLANETQVLDDVALRARLSRYFARIENCLEDALLVAQDENLLQTKIDCREVAVAIAACVQGGFVLSRARADAGEITRATRGAWRMVSSLLRDPEP